MDGGGRAGPEISRACVLPPFDRQAPLWFASIMFGRLRHARLSALALALYALATLVVGFAHKPVARAGVLHDLVVVAAQSDVLLALCDSDAPAQSHSLDRACDACSLTSAPGLPPANGCALPAPYGRSLALGFDRDAQFAPAAVHAPLSRGPPAA